MAKKKTHTPNRDTGIIFVHWESTDIHPTAGPLSRIYKQCGMAMLPQPESIRYKYSRGFYRWKIQVRVKLADNSIELVEFVVNEPVRILDLDNFMAPYMADLYSKFPEAIDRGWRAEVI